LYFEKALEKVPPASRPPNVLYALARMYEKEGNKPKALATYQQLPPLLEDGSPEIQKIEMRIVSLEEEAGK
jgi:tetratricopeptide (TPR) repeat protein